MAKHDVKALKAEVNEINAERGKKNIRCALDWYRPGKMTRKELVCSTDAYGQPWPDDEEPAYRLPVDFQWLKSVQPGRLILLDGGRGGGKSFTTASILLARAIDAPIRILSTRETQVSLKASSLQLFSDLIKRHSLPFEVMEREIRGKNGSLISFAGLREQSAEGIKSYEAYTYALIEESQMISKLSLSILLPTIRQEGSSIYLCLNRRYRTDAVAELMIEAEQKPAGLVHLQGSYEKNPFVSKTFIADAEDLRSKNPDEYSHRYGGNYRTNSENGILKFQVAPTADEFNKLLNDSRKLVQKSAGSLGRSLHSMKIQERKSAIERSLSRMEKNGLDLSSGGLQGRHGAVTAHFDDIRQLVYVEKEYYSNCSLKELPAQLLRTFPDWSYKPVICESAVPIMMRELKTAGITKIRPVRKTIPKAEQLHTLGSYLIIVHPDCKNFIDEISQFEWETDSAGFITDRPKKTPNHLIDGLIYSLNEQIIKDTLHTSGGYTPLKLTVV